MYYVVSLRKETPHIRKIIEAKYPNNHWPVSPTTFFLFFPDNKAPTIKDTASFLELTEGPAEGFVFSH